MYAHVAPDGTITRLQGEFKLTQTIVAPRDDGPADIYEDLLTFGEDFLDKRNDVELQAMSIYRIIPATPLGPHEIETGRTLALDGARPVEVITSIPFPLPDYKATRVQMIRDRRWNAEVGGLTVAALGGASFPSDERTQNRVANALKGFDVDPTMESVDWEVGPGVFASFTPEQVAALGSALTQHIQACFTRSKELVTAVNAQTSHTAIDDIMAGLDSGWPS